MNYEIFIITKFIFVIYVYSYLNSLFIYNRIYIFLQLCFEFERISEISLVTCFTDEIGKIAQSILHILNEKEDVDDPAVAKGQ